MRRWRALWIVAAGVITGCSNGNSSGALCAGSFLGGSTQWSCNNCSGLDPLDSNEDFAPTIDDDSRTATAFGIAPGGGQISIFASAANGTTFPAGADAGALMRFPAGSFTNVGIRFNTYNDGQMVGSLEGGATAPAGNVPGAGSDRYYEVQPTGAFDALEAVITLSGNPERADFLLYEFCGDR